MSGWILEGEYVDKTGLISLFDSTLNGPRKLVMVSRPRRFGKSYAAQSVVAFYSCGCDSRALFEGLQGDVLRAIGEEELRLNPYKFQNDMAAVASRDDALFCRRLGFVSEPTAEASMSTSSSSSATFKTWLRSTMSIRYTLWKSPLRYSSLSDARWY